MKGPIEYLIDLYDHEYMYYRWYLHRRVIFSNFKLKDLKPSNHTIDIFGNNDNENIIQLLYTSTVIGSAIGK